MVSICSEEASEAIAPRQQLLLNRAAVLASKETPAEIYGPAQKLADSIIKLPFSAAGGWQSPLEKKLLARISRVDSGCNIIHYLAKNINSLKLNDRQRQLLDDNRLLLISPGIQDNRPSRRQINFRDELMFSQTDKILFMFILAEI